MLQIQITNEDPVATICFREWSQVLSYLCICLRKETYAFCIFILGWKETGYNFSHLAETGKVQLYLTYLDEGY